jgi:hypothetical protein
MINLTEAQKELAVRCMNEYLNAGKDPETGQAPVAASRELDANRQKVISEILRPTVERFLDGNMSLQEFKPEIDRINKRNELWGFKGIKGQMFFNLVFNAAEDVAELTAELRSAITAPDSADIAKSRIKTFSSYVRRLGEEVVEAGGSAHAKPKPSSVPFFLSYFWQVQVPNTWPVYYTNSVSVLSDLNLLEPIIDLAESYIAYAELHLSLQDIFKNAAGRPFTLYDVEHVWWYRGRFKNASAPTVTTLGQSNQRPTVVQAAEVAEAPSGDAWDSYVPPVVGILPRLAVNEPLLEATAKATGTSVARLFEKSIHAAFTILGFDATLMGQGSGRAPDGIAYADDESYAVLWDAKVRQSGYRMGTDDRAIREYISSHSRDIKRRRHYRNVYYFIISSKFQDEFDDLIRGLKMDTDVNEVCLVEAEALVAFVDAKLRDPRQFSAGADGIQRLFCHSGIITSQDVREELG